MTRTESNLYSKAQLIVLSFITALAAVGNAIPLHSEPPNWYGAIVAGLCSIIFLASSTIR